LLARGGGGDGSVRVGMRRSEEVACKEGSYELGVQVQGIGIGIGTKEGMVRRKELVLEV